MFLERILLTGGILGIVGIALTLGFLTQNKDNGAEIQKNLGIVAAVTGVLVIGFGVIAYMYFTTNINYMGPFVLIMTFVNLLLSIFAISAASLQIINS